VMMLDAWIIGYSAMLYQLQGLLAQNDVAA
jgi:hypothetical protein